MEDENVVGFDVYREGWYGVMREKVKEKKVVEVGTTAVEKLSFDKDVTSD
jgi:hypothetical protein